MSTQVDTRVREGSSSRAPRDKGLSGEPWGSPGEPSRVQGEPEYQLFPTISQMCEMPVASLGRLSGCTSRSHKQPITEAAMGDKSPKSKKRNQSQKSAKKQQTDDKAKAKQSGLSQEDKSSKDKKK